MAATPPYGVGHGGGTAATDTGPRRAAPAPSAEAGHVPAAPETKPREPMTGMDMASLCVAVLGVWVLGALLRAVLARRGGPPLPARPMEQSTLGKKRYIDMSASRG
ncbi:MULTISPECIES: hypothetical protein [unclassified Streptomyces]|uniref:hypothetical protein n=1 Tax=unclassified Streptomyces TaxID=2593676 RepID=UPI00168B872A|nr:MULTISPECIES: hypothetical protein [unclassified Streptomyces]MBD3006081.1 hypothetical protein [Streptomyces sp. 5-10]